MSKIAARRFYVNRVRNYNWAIRSIAWGKRVAPAPLQKIAGKVADKVGTLIKKVQPDYLLGLYRIKADSYNYYIHGIDKLEVNARKPEIDECEWRIIELDLGDHPIDRELDAQINAWASALARFSSVEDFAREVTEWIRGIDESWKVLKGFTDPDPSGLYFSIVRETHDRFSRIAESDQFKAARAERWRIIEEKAEGLEIQVNSLTDYFRYLNMRMDNLLMGGMDMDMAAEVKAFESWEKTPAAREMSDKWDKLSGREKHKIIGEVLNLPI